MSTHRILGISGSLRVQSFNSGLLRALPGLAPDGMTIEVFDGVGDLPLYDQDLDTASAPEPVARLRAAIADANGLIFASPEYNHSMSGVMKNTIDWASRPFGRAPILGQCACVFVATGGKISGARAHADTTRVLRDLSVYVVGTPEVIVTEAASRIVFGEDGSVTVNDPMSIKLIQIQLTALAAAIDGGAGATAAQPLRDLLASMAPPPSPRGDPKQLRSSEVPKTERAGARRRPD